MHAHRGCCKTRPVNSHAQLNYPAAPALYPAESPTRGLSLYTDTKPLGLTMKLQAVEFTVKNVTRQAPGIFHITATGPATYVFRIFTCAAYPAYPIVISSEAPTELLRAIYYLNKQEIHARADEAT